MASEYKTVIKEKKNVADKLMTSEELKACNIAIHTASVAAGAEGVIPIPGVDAVPISATQAAMVFALGKIFEQKLTDSTVKALIGTAASTFAGRNLIKLVPFIGWATSAVVAAGVTEAIGWTIAVDFAKSHQKDVKINNENQYTTEKFTEESNTTDCSAKEENTRTTNPDKEETTEKADDQSMCNDVDDILGGSEDEEE